MAGQQLATIADLETHGGLAQAFSRFSDDQKNAHLSAASRMLLGWASTRAAAALTAWSDDFIMNVCAFAAYTLIATRGYNPGNPADVALRMRRDDAERWAKEIGSGKTTPPDIVDATPGIADAAPIGCTPDGSESVWGIDCGTVP